MAYTWGAVVYRDSYYGQQVGIDMTVSGTTISWKTAVQSTGSMYATNPYSVTGSASRSGSYTANYGSAFTMQYASGSFSGTEGNSYSINTNSSMFWGGKPSHSRSLSIPVTASVPTLSKSSFTSGDSAITINFNRKSTTYKFTLQFRFSTTVIQTVVTQVTAASTTHAPTVAQIGARIPNSISGTFNYNLITYNSAGSNLGSRTVNITCSLDSSVRPALSGVSHSDAAIAPVSNKSPYQTLYDISPSIAAYVSGLSKLKLTGTATGVNGSTISGSGSGIFFSYGNSTYPIGSTPTLNSDTNTVSVYCIDSRGRQSVPQTIALNIIAYTSPKVTPNPFVIQRTVNGSSADESGTNIKVTATTSVHSMTLGGSQRNRRTVNLHTALVNSADWVSRYSLSSSSSISGAVPSTTAYGGNSLLIQNSYQVRLTISDIFQSMQFFSILPASSFTMSWAKDGIGVGKVWQRGALDVGGNSYFSGPVRGNIFQARELDFLANTSTATILRQWTFDQDISGWNTDGGVQVSRTTVSQEVYSGSGAMKMTLLGSGYAAGAVRVLPSQSVVSGDIVRLWAYGNSDIDIALSASMSNGALFYRSFEASTQWTQLEVTIGETGTLSSIAITIDGAAGSALFIDEVEIIRESQTAIVAKIVTNSSGNAFLNVGNESILLEDLIAAALRPIAYGGTASTPAISANGTADVTISIPVVPSGEYVAIAIPQGSKGVVDRLAASVTTFSPTTGTLVVTVKNHTTGSATASGSGLYWALIPRN